MKQKFLFVVGCLILSSCTSPSIELDAPAKKVPLKASVTKAQLQGYERGKQIVCELGANGHSDSSNGVACENHLRNEGARIGAAFVVLESKGSGSSTYYKKLCNNCQVMSGWAYVKKSAQSKKEDEKTRDFLDESDDGDEKDQVAASEDEKQGEGANDAKSEEDSKPKRVVVKEAAGAAPFSFDLDVANAPKSPSASVPGKSSFGKAQKAAREPASKARGRTKFRKKPESTAPDRGIDSVSKATKQPASQPGSQAPNQAGNQTGNQPSHQPANSKAQPKK